MRLAALLEHVDLPAQARADYAQVAVEHVTPGGKAVVASIVRHVRGDGVPQMMAPRRDDFGGGVVGHVVNVDDFDRRPDAEEQIRRQRPSDGHAGAHVFVGVMRLLELAVVDVPSPPGRANPPPTDWSRQASNCWR